METGRAIPRLARYDVPAIDRYVFFNPASAACLVTDSRGRAILDRYLDELEEGAGSPEGRSEGLPEAGSGACSADAFIERAQKVGIFRAVEREPAYGQVPHRLIVELTAACNLRCKTCYMSASRPEPNEMTTEEVLALLGHAAESGTETVALIGGEPMLRRDLAALTDFALGAFSDVMISTNGTLLDDAFLARFDGRPNLTIQISVDGPDAVSHDAIRGAGAFGKASAAFDLARAHGIRTAVSSVVNRHNYNLVGLTCDFASGKSAIMAIFHRVHMFGRAQDFPEIAPAREQMMHGMGVLFEKYDQYEGAGRMIVDFPPNRCFRGDTLLDSAYLGCHFGRASAYVTSTGNLACCSHLRDGEYSCGNVREQPLLEIWRDSPVLERMRQMTVDDLPSCKACAVRYMCRGSCRADALGHAGSIDGDTYDCEALKAYYTYVLDYYARNLAPVLPGSIR